MTRTVVVTGGGTGIGHAIATRFAEDGARVIITGRRQSALDRAAADIAGNVEVAHFDATDADAVTAFAAEIGPVDVVVNNAGGNTDFDRTSPNGLGDVADSWRANFESNVLTTVLMTTSLLPRMNGGGTVITIGSIAADKGSGSYGAAKAAIASWNIDLARQLGPRSITANVVAPGYIADTEFFRDVLTDDAKDGMAASAMTRRAGTPQDIAEMVQFLASDRARQITAQTFAVNGGEWPSR
ncbi:3-oxoacyl-ACP reductase [Rhodococcus sp. 06-235-1A]|uniref:SDR family NAD(P)-dependent oxidoreductase n=1 Tax=Rhodococcus sp. 06-235-1A TaxID=2022508 RepID=UPI000B9A317E|nr:SDR family oxidoreductase [Rhodococcus sp. 06-235-1A]OZD08005.1 3-oxoacyl-ACP reductase [Rhodococcus sp. 06-235-1A]